MLAYLDKDRSDTAKHCAKAISCNRGSSAKTTKHFLQQGAGIVFTVFDAVVIITRFQQRRKKMEPGLDDNWNQKWK